jgi:beta-lactamase regulating signal transducer with metallopeptidase domain
MAVGFFRPAVILRESLPPALDRNELGHVLLHESGYLARFDYWTNLAARLLAAALALRPVALWILRLIDRKPEIACNDWGVARTGHARNYAASLVRMCELRWSHEPVLAAGILGRGSRTAQRIELKVSRGREFS